MSIPSTRREQEAVLSDIWTDKFWTRRPTKRERFSFFLHFLFVCSFSSMIFTNCSLSVQQLKNRFIYFVYFFVHLLIFLLPGRSSQIARFLPNNSCHAAPQHLTTLLEQRDPALPFVFSPIIGWPVKLILQRKRHFFQLVPPSVCPKQLNLFILLVIFFFI